MKNRRLFITLILLFVAFATLAQWTPQTVINQRLIDNSYVSDANHLLTPAETEQLNRILGEMEAETGVQFAIVVLDSISDRWDAVGFGVELFNLWGIGTKENNKGLMLLIVTNTHDWRFFSGYGVEGDLPDVTLKRLGRNRIVPAFRNKEYGKGLIEVSEDIKQILIDNKEVASDKESTNITKPWKDPFLLTLWLSWFALVGFALYFMLKKPKSGKKRQPSTDRVFTTKLIGSDAAVLKPDKPAIPNIWRGKPMLRFFTYYILAGIVPILATYSGYGMIYPVFNAMIGLYIYFFLLAVVVQYRLNKTAKAVSEDGPAQFLNLTEANKMMSFRIAFYPLVFLPYYLIYKHRLNRLKSDDTHCRQCNRTAHYIPREQYAQFLTPAELTEIKVKSKDTHLYQCSAGHLTQIQFTGKKAVNYSTCPSCKTMTMKKTGKKTIQKATYSATGKGETELSCISCGKKIYRPFVIPRKVRSSSSSGGSGGSWGGSGGGSWGGGRTGGGGAGGKW